MDTEAIDMMEELLLSVDKGELLVVTLLGILVLAAVFSVWILRRLRQ